MPETHKSLVAALKIFDNVDVAIAGNESYLSEIFAKVSHETGVGLKAIGGELASKTVAALRAADTAILKAVGARRLLNSTLVNRVRSVGIKDEISFSSAFLSKLTINGDVDDLHHSLVIYRDVVSGIVKYELELQAYYHKELELLKSATQVKDTASAVALVGKLDALKFPVPEFPNKHNSMLESDILPGGNRFRYNTETNKFTIESGSSAQAEDITVSFAKEAFVLLLADSNKLIESCNQFVKATTKYGDYVKSFNTVVGKSFDHLEGLRGSVSSSVITDLESRLEGNAKVFAFYSGFLPKVILGIDNHVEALTSFLSKQFN